MPRERPRVLVIGIGNRDRGDDAAGRAVAQRLKDRLPVGVEIEEHDGEATSLVALLEGVDTAILIDACVSGAKPGTVHRFDVGAAPLPQTRSGVSTHGLGLGEAVELARTLGQLPPRVIVYAIEGRAFETGAALSPPVVTAVEEASERIRAELKD